jgi:hypothetical protein
LDSATIREKQTMNDHEYYTTCAIAAMAALIRKVPLADKEAGQDADGIGYEICKSADRYAADMVRIRRERIGPMLPEAKESNVEVQRAAQPLRCNDLLGRDQAASDPTTGAAP